jgi:hypothetical protein
VTNGVVDLEATPIYLSAEEEEEMLISQANIGDGQFWECSTKVGRFPCN